MTEDEINAELILVNSAISRILQLGEEYEIDSSSSKRKSRSSTLADLKIHRSDLLQQLQGIIGNSGLSLTF